MPAAYLRVQPGIDSNAGNADNWSCIQMIDGATAVASGGAGISASNRVYAVSDPPPLVIA